MLGMEVLHKERGRGRVMHVDLESRKPWRIRFESADGSFRGMLLEGGSFRGMLPAASETSANEHDYSVSSVKKMTKACTCPHACTHAWTHGCTDASTHTCVRTHTCACAGTSSAMSLDGAFVLHKCCADVAHLGETQSSETRQPGVCYKESGGSSCRAGLVRSVARFCCCPRMRWWLGGRSRLFRMLDIDGTGSLDADEMLAGATLCEHISDHSISFFQRLPSMIIRSIITRLVIACPVCQHHII